MSEGAATFTHHSSRNVCPLRLHIDGVDRLAGGHEEAVAARAAEADIRADLRQQNLADSLAVRGDDVHSVIAGSDPAGGRPDIPVHVRPDAVRVARDLLPV